MLKRITALALSFCVAIGAVGCGKKEAGKGNGLTDSYACTMVVTPASVKLDKSFLENYKDVKNVVLPEDYDKNMDKITDEIASFADNEKVKCIIVCSDKDGMLPVFEKIKEKNENITTIAAGLEELQVENEENKADMNEYINIGFNPTDKDNNQNAVRMAETIGANVFVNYVDDIAKDSVDFRDKSRDMQRECEKNDIKYIEVLVPGMKDEKDSKTAEEFIKKDAVNKKKAYGENVALYGCREAMDKATIDAAIENGLMVPNIHSLNSTKLYGEILGVDTNKGDYTEINSKISEKLKSMGMEGRLAGTYIPEKVFCVEVAVDTSNKIYKKMVKENEVLNDIRIDIKEKTGILAEYSSMEYYNSFLRAVNIYPVLY